MDNEDLEDVITYMMDNVSETFWTATTAVNTASPSLSEEHISIVVKALRQISDADSMEEAEYLEKYGADAAYDPYVIASNAINKIPGENDE